MADVLPNELQSLDIASRIRVDPDATRMASRDFGKLVHPPNPAAPPGAKAIPPRTSHGSSWGCGEMRSLNNCSRGSGIRVTKNPISGSYADAGDIPPCPQISNVYEMDVLLVSYLPYPPILIVKGTCDLFQRHKLRAVFCGFRRSRAVWDYNKSKDRSRTGTKKSKMDTDAYDDFSTFSRDQEHLISINGLDYLEGSLLMQNSSPNNWRSSFPPSEYPRISSLISKNGIIYCLEVVKYYDELTSHTVMRLQLSVFRDILPKINQTTGTFLVYPVIRNKWDDRTSAVIPDEDIFYTVGLLHSSGADNWEPLENQNKEILKFCDKAGIKIKRYLSRYTTKKDWMNHFGPKWRTFEDRKAQFDPKMILSPGQQIFISI
ncbi:Cytokinin dehydrogenase 3 [Vitis vinifera]|uniref:Cytokinin dehydrogenase 3 n=1 Tax=Vitis vinifera TaxID=29760 RepID=A0A438FWG8_VITVI|nr:Cytokinin dehydrogenase 3 [Vitis vinifera]